MPNAKTQTEKLYEYFLMPKCTVSVSEHSRQLMRAGAPVGRKTDKHVRPTVMARPTFYHIQQRMRAKKGCDMPPFPTIAASEGAKPAKWHGKKIRTKRVKTKFQMRNFQPAAQRWQKYYESNPNAAGDNPFDAPSQNQNQNAGKRQRQPNLSPAQARELIDSLTPNNVPNSELQELMQFSKKKKKNNNKKKKKNDNTAFNQFLKNYGKNTEGVNNNVLKRMSNAEMRQLFNFALGNRNDRSSNKTLSNAYTADSKRRTRNNTANTSTSRRRAPTQLPDEQMMKLLNSIAALEKAQR